MFSNVAVDRPRASVGVAAAARCWFALAIGSLVIAGLLSLAVVIGRLPMFTRVINDPLFFKRCLVVHVDLALVVWFYAFLAGLARLRSQKTGVIGAIAFALSVAGVTAMLAGALMRGAEPVLANYVPAIDHPLFLGGLTAFFAATGVFLVTTLAGEARLRPAAMPAETAVGLQAAAIGFVLAGTTWVATRAALPDGLETWTRFEFSAWGAGHVLQVTNATAMLAVWFWLVRRASGESVLGPRAARMLFTLLLAPQFAMPLLTIRGALHPLYHSGATLLMRWGVFPLVLTAMALCLRHWRRHPRLASDPLARVALVGFLGSATLTALGFALGACIRTSTTMVPAHYHASLGGVTVAFMTAAYLVCAEISGTGNGLATAKLARAGRRQLLLFGGGQSIFAIGFAVGGAYGLGRKTYATEQHVRGLGEYFGLGVMGLGGLVAAVAGVWFLFLVVREMRHWMRRGTSARPIHSTP